MRFFTQIVMSLGSAACLFIWFQDGVSGRKKSILWYHLSEVPTASVQRPFLGKFMTKTKDLYWCQSCAFQRDWKCRVFSGNNQKNNFIKLFFRVQCQKNSEKKSFKQVFRNKLLYFVKAFLNQNHPEISTWVSPGLKDLVFEWRPLLS